MKEFNKPEEVIEEVKGPTKEEIEKQERLEKETIENERKAKEILDNERKENERKENERLEKESLEKKKPIERPYIGQTEEELASLLVKWRDIYRNSIIARDKENAHTAIREIEKEQKRRK